MTKNLKLYGYCGLIAVALYLVVFIVLAALEPGYSHVRHFPSELGSIHATNASIMNGMFHIVGVLVWIFAWGLHVGLPKGKTSFWGPLMLAILGTSMFLAGFFQCDTGCLPTTFESQMHGTVGLPGLFASPLAPLLVYFRLKSAAAAGENNWPAFYQKVSLFSFWVQIVGIAALFPFREGDVAGIAIRIMLVVQLFWPTVMAYGLATIKSKEA